MKSLTSFLAWFRKKENAQRNATRFMRFSLALLLLIVLYSVAFCFLMGMEGRSYSWVTGLYWTLTVMSTLGFGDITFVSDIGKLFSILVLVTGIIFLLVMLPYAFIEYVYSPWMEQQKKNRIPRSVPPEISDHIIVVGVTPISTNLVRRLEQFGFYCVLLSPDIQQTLDLEEQGFHAVAGDYDDEETYGHLRLKEAGALLALDTDQRNSNIIFSARVADAGAPVFAKAANPDAIDILELAGATHVFQFRPLLGQALARRVAGNSGQSSEITGFSSLSISETSISGTILVGKTLRDLNLRQRFGINVLGLWTRGKFMLPSPDEPFGENTVIITAGTREQTTMFSESLVNRSQEDDPGTVIVLGAGKVGLAAVRELLVRGLDVRLVDKNQPASLPEGISFVRGDASDLAVLEKAGINEADSVIITTHDDDTNVYLTIYCRKLRPDIQIVSRATLDRSTGNLHRAGADIVLSLVSMMTNSIIDMLSPGKVYMINEGLSLFKAPITETLAGKCLKNCGIRSETKCNVVALKEHDGTLTVSPEPDRDFVAGEEIFLIGDSAGREAFSEKFGLTTF